MTSFVEQDGETQWYTVFRVEFLFEQVLALYSETAKHSQTFADLSPYIFTVNSDDSISMTRGASSLEDYFLNLLIRHQLAVF